MLIRVWAGAGAADKILGELSCERMWKLVVDSFIRKKRLPCFCHSRREPTLLPWSPAFARPLPILGRAKGVLCGR